MYIGKLVNRVDILSRRVEEMCNRTGNESSATCVIEIVFSRVHGYRGNSVTIAHTLQ